MPQDKPLPSELRSWLKDRLDNIDNQARKIHQSTLKKEWKTDDLLEVLEDLANLEANCRRAVHLYTAYAVRTGIASASEVARRTNITPTAATSRAGSTLAAASWQEAFGKR